MNILGFANRKGDKTYFYYNPGRGKGQRPATGIFIYTHPKDQIQKNHNKEALKLLEVKKSQATIEQQAIGSAFIPAHKFNRHLVNSLAQFKLFIKNDSIAPIDITENICKRFRQYLLDKYTGQTPLNYFSRFKWVVNAAESDGYFHKSQRKRYLLKPIPLLS